MLPKPAREPRKYSRKDQSDIIRETQKSQQRKSENGENIKVQTSKKPSKPPKKLEQRQQIASRSARNPQSPATKEEQLKTFPKFETYASQRPKNINHPLKIQVQFSTPSFLPKKEPTSVSARQDTEPPLESPSTGISPMTKKESREAPVMAGSSKTHETEGQGSHTPDTGSSAKGSAQSSDAEGSQRQSQHWRNLPIKQVAFYPSSGKQTLVAPRSDLPRIFQDIEIPRSLRKTPGRLALKRATESPPLSSVESLSKSPPPEQSSSRETAKVQEDPSQDETPQPETSQVSPTQGNDDASGSDISERSSSFVNSHPASPTKHDNAIRGSSSLASSSQSSTSSSPDPFGTLHDLNPQPNIHYDPDQPTATFDLPEPQRPPSFSKADIDSDGSSEGPAENNTSPTSVKAEWDAVVRKHPKNRIVSCAQNAMEAKNEELSAIIAMSAETIAANEQLTAQLQAWRSEAEGLRRAEVEFKAYLKNEVEERLFQLRERLVLLKENRDDEGNSGELKMINQQLRDREQEKETLEGENPHQYCIERMRHDQESYNKLNEEKTKENLDLRDEILRKRTENDELRRRLIRLQEGSEDMVDKAVEELDEDVDGEENIKEENSKGEKPFVPTVDSIELRLVRIKLELQRMIAERSKYGVRDEDCDHLIRMATEGREMATDINHATGIAEISFWQGVVEYFADNLPAATKSFEFARNNEKLPALEQGFVEGWLERIEYERNERGDAISEGSTADDR